MEFILLLLLSFFIEAIIIWQYTANLFIQNVLSVQICFVFQQSTLPYSYLLYSDRHG